MIKIIKLLFVVTTIAFLGACDSESKFHDLAKAIERNKLNVSSIVVESTKNKTIACATDPCDTTYLPTNKTETFIARGLTPDGQPLDISDRVVWSTTDSAKAQVNQAGNLTTGTTLGEVEVIASFASIAGRAKIMVSSATLPSDNEIIIRHNGQDVTTTPDVTKCDMYDMDVIGDFGDSQRIITHDIKWNVTVASAPTTDAKVVLNEGDNIAVFSSHTPTPQPPENPAPYEVKASYQNDPNDANTIVTRTINMNVIEGNFGNVINMTPGTKTITQGTTFQFTATASIDGNNKDVTHTAKWETTNGSVATVDNGLVTGKDIGQANITASCGGVSQQASVTVEQDPTLVSIKIKDTNEKDTFTVLNLTLSSTTDNEKDVVVMASYTNQDETNITDELTEQNIEITALDGNTPLPISYELLTDEKILRITARRVGAAVLKVTYSGQEDTLTVNVK